MNWAGYTWVTGWTARWTAGWTAIKGRILYLVTATQPSPRSSEVAWLGDAGTGLVHAPLHLVGSLKPCTAHWPAALSRCPPCLSWPTCCLSSRISPPPIPFHLDSARARLPQLSIIPNRVRYTGQPRRLPIPQRGFADGHSAGRKKEDRPQERTRWTLVIPLRGQAVGNLARHLTTTPKGSRRRRRGRRTHYDASQAHAPRTLAANTSTTSSITPSKSINICALPPPTATLNE